MSVARHHAEWLSMVPNTGPFISMPVLLDIFPAGLSAHDPDHYRQLRRAYSEWEDNNEEPSPSPDVHLSWIKYVLTQTLEIDRDLLVEGQAIPPTLQHELPEHSDLLKPDIVLNDPTSGKARLLVRHYPVKQSLSSYLQGSRWKASPETRMT